MYLEPYCLSQYRCSDAKYVYLLNLAYVICLFIQSRYLTALVMTLTPLFAHYPTDYQLGRDLADGQVTMHDMGEGSTEEMAEELCVLCLIGGLSTGALLSWAWLLLPRA